MSMLTCTARSRLANCRQVSLHNTTTTSSSFCYSQRTMWWVACPTCRHISPAAMAARRGTFRTVNTNCVGMPATALSFVSQRESVSFSWLFISPWSLGHRAKRACWSLPLPCYWPGLQSWLVLFPGGFNGWWWGVPVSGHSHTCLCLSFVHLSNFSHLNARCLYAPSLYLSVCLSIYLSIYLSLSHTSHSANHRSGIQSEGFRSVPYRFSPPSS